MNLSKKSYAKVNIFLKISGKRGTYHELVSRFVRVRNLFDRVSFEEKKADEFTLIGNFGCETKKNTIYKVYEKLKDIKPEVEEFFKNHIVTVEKNIPEFAGLGGGSSNAATFLIMINDVLNLQMSKDQLAILGLEVGADIPFFVYEYDSANVTGIGEIVEKFDEEILPINTFTPKVKCDTGKIFTNFRDKFYSEISKEQSQKLLCMKSTELLEKLSTEEANDLYLPAITAYDELKEYKNAFFSGSGSSFFNITGEKIGS